MFQAAVWFVDARLLLEAENFILTHMLSLGGFWLADINVHSDADDAAV